MESQKIFIKKLIEYMGFSDYRVDLDEDQRHGAVFIHDEASFIKENLPVLIEHINHVAQVFARKENTPSVFFDINNYRHEREKLITELARAAARKVLSTKKEISLPAMNSYERRLVHLELSVHPEVVTESVGTGKDRYVIIKLFEAKEAPTISGQEDIASRHSG